jgi:hypothetical protein
MHAFRFAIFFSKKMSRSSPFCPAIYTAGSGGLINYTSPSRRSPRACPSWPELKRRIIVLYWIEEQPLPAIASALDVSEDRVWSTIRRARPRPLDLMRHASLDADCKKNGKNSRFRAGNSGLDGYISIEAGQDHTTRHWTPPRRRPSTLATHRRRSPCCSSDGHSHASVLDRPGLLISAARASGSYIVA